MAHPKLDHQDARIYPRLTATLPGHLLLKSDSTTICCTITDISAGGAGLTTQTQLAINTEVVLYVEGFGRFDAHVARSETGIIGLKFECKDAKRQRLLDGIAAFSRSGLKALTRLRRHPRNALLDNGYFTRPNGETVRYDAVDISLRGLSVLTNARPPVGEILNLGLNYGRVARHHELGIAIEFLDASSQPKVLRHGN